MNRIERRFKREQEARVQKDLEKRELEADIIKKAQICRKFVNDKKYSDFKDLFCVSLVEDKRREWESLRYSVENNDEYLRRSLVLETEINTIKKIFDTPEMFFKAEEKIKGAKE